MKTANNLNTKDWSDLHLWTFMYWLSYYLWFLTQSSPCFWKVAHVESSDWITISQAKRAMLCICMYSYTSLTFSHKCLSMQYWSPPSSTPRCLSPLSSPLSSPLYLTYPFVACLLPQPSGHPPKHTSFSSMAVSLSTWVPLSFPSQIVSPIISPCCISGAEIGVELLLHGSDRGKSCGETPWPRPHPSVIK